MHNKEPHIVIIGAGLAGLAAAQQLISNKFNVTVLEARDRIGGRTWTDESLGFPFDIGAFIIHGIENNPVIELCQRFAVNHEPQPLDGFYFANKKQLVTGSENDFIAEEFLHLLQAASDYANLQAVDISLHDAMQSVYNAKKYLHLTPDIFRWRSLFLPLYTGADTDKLSGKNWDKDETPLPGGNHMILDGYQPIVDGLAKNINIQLNSPVSHIRYYQTGVEILTKQKTFQADAVVVTLPLGILKAGKVKFEPELPAKKQQAISRLGMGVLNKIALKFPATFWPTDCRIITYLAKSYPSVAWFLNYERSFHHAVLVGFFGGSIAHRFETKKDEEIVAEVMSVLRQYVSSPIPDPLHYLITRWASDPYTLGSYSYIPINASGADYDTLAEPIDNKIFFAGEATNKFFPGTTHGAYLSGMREAKRITDIFF